jgi:hypothetical protein
VSGRPPNKLVFEIRYEGESLTITVDKEIWRRGTAMGDALLGVARELVAMHQRKEQP